MEPTVYHPNLDEYRAARASGGLRDLSDREVLRITGEDRVSFLHGMVTNDVNRLPEGGVCYAAMLTPKGAMVADARIWRRAGDLLVETEPGAGPRVRDFLEKHLISEDAEIQDAGSELAVVGVIGPRSGDWLRAALGMDTPEAGRFQPLEPEGTWVAVTSSLLAGVTGFDLLVPRASLSRWLERLMASGRALGASPLSRETWEVLRVEAGVPRFGQDMEESTIPLEANLQRAISYDKGCYIGQEVIARATFRGHMNRKLTGLLVGEHAAAPGTELRKGDKKVGWLTSVAHSPAKAQLIALGYVHRDCLEPGTKLDLGGPGGEAVVHPLPFIA